MAWCGTKDKNNYTNKKYHNGRTATKSNQKSHINRDKIDTLQTHVITHFPWLVQALHKKVTGLN
jgi:hypothetical protein